MFDDGETVRETDVPLTLFCVKPSDQVTENGAMPLRIALTVAEAPGQIAPPPLTSADGRPLTVTVALPLEVPLQFASVIEVMVYVVLDDGETVRVAVVPLTFWLKPSDQVMENGAAPVSAALTVDDPPEQIVPPPLTLAVGAELTVTTTGCDCAVQPLRSTTVTSYEPGCETVIDCHVAPLDQV